nr:hypothetical protein [Tanacetum cinerariifolium]
MLEIQAEEDEAVYEEWDDSVERATTIAASLDAAQDSGILKTQSTTRSARVPTPPHDSPLPRVNTHGSDEGRRMIEDIDQDTGITLVTPTKVSSQEDRLEDQLGVLSAAKVLTDETKKKVNTYTRRKRVVSTGSEAVSTTSRIVSTADVVQEGVTDKDEELAQKMLEEERESLSIAKRAKLLIELIDKRKKLQAVQRYEANRNKPQTMSQQRKTMCTGTNTFIPTMLEIQGEEDEAIYEEWDDSVERATTIAASLDAAQDSGILKTQSTIMPNVPLPQRINTCGSPRKGSSFEDRLKANKESIWYCFYQAYHERRMIEDIDQDIGITLVTPTKVSSQEDQLKDQFGVLSAAKVLTDVTKKKVNTYTRRKRVVSTGSEAVSTTSRIVSTADVVQEGVTDKAQIQADEELAQKMLEEERESLSIAKRAKLLIELIDKRKKLQAAQRYEANRNKPQTMSQQRKTMCTYMKNMAGYKMEHFKGKSFYEVKEIFDKVYKQVTSFVPMESDMEKERTKRAGLNLQEESSKREKTEEVSESTEEPKANEISQED